MPVRRRPSRRTHTAESPGVIDFPWDADPNSPEGPRNDVTCAIPWRVEDYEAIEVYLDPALAESARALCDTIQGIAARHRDIDTLSQALLELGSEEDLAVAIHEDPAGALSRGVVAVAITLG